MNNSELQALADMISANVTLNHKEVLTADEAARYMGVSKSYLYKLTMQGKVPFSKPLGKMCYFNRLELEAWLMSNRQATIDEISDKALSFCAHARTFSKKKGGQR